MGRSASGILGQEIAWVLIGRSGEEAWGLCLALTIALMFRFVVV